MRVGSELKRNGEIWTVYKINFEGKVYAENEFKTSLWCLPLKIIK